MKNRSTSNKRIQTRAANKPSARHIARKKNDKPKVIQFFAKDNNGGSPLNYFYLFWIFVIASVLGLIFETIYHSIFFGGYESRAGLVWGPFSPIYGCGAVLFTLVSRGKQVEKKSRAIISVFLVCAFCGAALEFTASWLMQTFFGVMAWDYSGTFLNIDGRTNLYFSVIWGLLGTAWICWFLPTILKFIDRIPENKHVLVTVLLSIFMALNIITTIMAVGRAYERAQGVPAQSEIENLLDSQYSDEYLRKRFENTNIAS
ncbi:MAG: putative ABC transporter permease [Coriobacteriales bacterium]|jgi:uncharacterized membrane protein|nr:putative ABC transporter permease [Coriobacteriales bacterium]